MSYKVYLSAMSSEKEIHILFTPRFVGERFDDHGIPLSILSELSILEDITLLIAKDLYLKGNVDRKRVLKNFDQGITFELKSIEKGSVIPTIVLVCAMNGLFPVENSVFFKDAGNKLISTIEKASLGLDISNEIPRSAMAQFSKFGKGLRQDEFIEFDQNLPHKAKFDLRTRINLVSAAGESEFSANTKIRGFVSEMNKAKKTFNIESISGAIYTLSYSEDQKQEVHEAFSEYENKSKILVEGTGKVDSSGKLISIEEVDKLTLLDDLDVQFRLDELSLLKDGWLEGNGISPSDDGLSWISESFDKYFHPNLDLPYIYPTPDGNIQAEWEMKNWSVTLDVQLNNKIGYYHAFETISSKEIERDINLSTESGWSELNILLGSLDFE